MTRLLLVAALAGFVAATRAQERQLPVDPALFQGLQWRNIGPFRGGRVVAIAGVPGDLQTYYFGGVGSGVWKTTDGGEVWTNVSDDAFKTSSVGAIAVADSDSNVVYVGMGEHAVRGVATSHGDGVYKSTDGGRAWRHIGLEKTRAISRIRVHPGNPDLVYVAAQGAPYGATKERGIYRSRDGGGSWEQVLFVSESAGASDLAMDPTNPRVLYAAFWDHQRYPWHVRSGGPGSGFHTSDDGGDTWQKISNGMPALMGKTAIAVAPGGERLYALVEADPNGGLYRSDDRGRTWTLVNEQWNIRTRAWYYIKVYADPVNPDVAWITNAQLLKSIDAGRTFAPVLAPHGDHHNLWINPRDPRAVINANDGGANISFTGGRTWSTQGNQPTGQFYRVNTDNRFPYWVYGGQQDNTTVAIASRGPATGISEREWHPVGGCESGFVTFDPDNPARVYAGCFIGQISEYETRTDVARDVMAYPTLLPAVPPRDMKYRFNWNAPILVSRHDPRVIYHGANVLLRSDNRGRTWREASPDLTRDDDEKQGKGGGPITNEGAGGEIFGTIAYVAESPHDAGTLWTGSDDGVVSVTRDGGKTWKNVTPPQVLADSLVNAVEVSPHDPATAYIAVSRYKLNDFTPHLFKTMDYGRTWSRLVDGIGAEAWVRVVREDPVRKDLLYAGTETGIYVSFSGGARWQPLQLNLPVTPVNDIKVHGSDLVVATGGRAFWILDNVTPLRQVDASLAASDLHLFTPSRAVRLAEAGGPGGGIPRSLRVGTNPPAGAQVDFTIAKVPADGVTLEIKDAGDRLVRRYTSAPRPGEPDMSPLAVRAGHNRMAWDLRHAAVPPVPGLFVFGSLQGRKALPGAYTVRLTAAGKTVTRTLEVVTDPRLTNRAEDLTAQDELMAAVDRDLTEIHRAVVRLRAVREQVVDVLRRLKTANAEALSRLEKPGRALVDRITALEDALIQTRTVDGQTIINFGMKLNQYYIYLRNAIDGGDTGVTDGARQRFADLSAEWSQSRAELTRVIEDEVAAFNVLARDLGVGTVVVPR